MSSQQEPTAVAVARAHVEAWGGHDYDSARASLAPAVHVVVMSVDPEAPRVETTGMEEYMEGLVQFGQIVVPGTTRVKWSVGDDDRALLHVTSKVKFGPDAPEMDHHQPHTRCARLSFGGAHVRVRACAPGLQPLPGGCGSDRRPHGWHPRPASANRRAGRGSRRCLTRSAEHQSCGRQHHRRPLTLVRWNMGALVAIGVTPALPGAARRYKPQDLRRRQDSAT